MNVLLLTLGTRGDVQPYLALAKGLLARGHRVRLCAPASFRRLIEAQAVPYAHMDNGFMDLLDSMDGRKLIDETRSLATMVRAWLRVMHQVKPLQRKVFDDCWAACLADAPDLIVGHVKTLFAIDFAAQLRVPVAIACFQPALVSTSEFPTLALPELPLGRTWNRASYALVRGLIRAMEGAHVNRWRVAVGLGRRRRRQGLLETDVGGSAPVLHAFSPSLVATPKDWPADAAPTGHWFLDEGDGWTMPPDLARFLDHQPPPIYIGFGSMAGRNPERVGRIVREALVQTGLRAIVATGRGGIAGLESVPAVFEIEAAPHDALFPRVAAVVHHGGAGTTAAGLRAGRPTLICPFFGDQPFWGRRVRALGAGPAPIPQHHLSVTRLASALQELCTNAAFAERAAALGAAMRAEDGAATAIARLESLV